MILTIMKILDGAWVFTAIVIVVGEEDGKEVCELTWSKRGLNLRRLAHYHEMEQNQRMEKPSPIRAGGSDRASVELDCIPSNHNFSSNFKISGPLVLERSGSFTTLDRAGNTVPYFLKGLPWTI